MATRQIPTIVDVARQHAFNKAHETAFTFSLSEEEELHLTFAELDKRARSIAAHLIDKKLTGERALLLFMPDLNYLTAFFGCLYAGVVAVPAYPPDPTRLGRTLPRLLSIIKNCEAKVILTTELILGMAQSLFPDPEDQGLNWVATDALSDEWAEGYRMPTITPDTLAFLQYTSGSTSDPKGVMLTHNNILANLELQIRDYKVDDVVSVSWLPPYHDMGLIGGMLQPVFSGRLGVLMSPMDFLSNPYRWLKVMTDKKGTVSAGPNFAYDLCVRRITEQEKATLDLSTWRFAVNGAEPVRLETMERFAEAFAPAGFRKSAFFPSYGLAEFTLYVTGGSNQGNPSVLSVDQNQLAKGQAVPTSDSSNANTLVGCGIPAKDVTLCIVDKTTHQELPEGQVGEIWVSHASVAQGYYNQPQKTEEMFNRFTKDHRGPFLRTGDLGFVLKGELFVTGREKDLIIIRGANHYPQDIELTLETQVQGIRPGCLAAFSVEAHTQEGLGIVAEVKKHRSPEELDQIIDDIRRVVATEHGLFVEAIALIKSKSIYKTSSGKIQRHACKEMLQTGQLDAVKIWRHIGQDHTSIVPLADESDGLKARLRRHIVDVLGQANAANLKEDAPLVQYGLDSLMRQELMAAIEGDIQRRLPNDAIHEKTSLTSLLSLISKNQRDWPKLDHAPSAPTKDKEIQPSWHDFELLAPYVALKEQFNMLSAMGIENPFFTEHDGLATDTTSIGGKTYINFSHYNYIGLSGHPRIMEAAKAAIDQYGTSVSASRLVSGERPIHTQLERAIADFVGVQDAIVFVGGHATNVTTIGHLLSSSDLIVYDSLSHNSIQLGARLSEAKLIPFPHNDWKALDHILTNHRKRYEKCLIVIEGVYSMDGDIPDLKKYVEIKKRHKAFLMVDEAHSIGVLGKTGRGLAEFCDVSPSDVDIWMGTLSKSFVSCGGYIAGTKALVEYLRYSAPGFVFSVGIPPSNAAASLAALSVLKDEPWRTDKLRHNSQLFLQLAKEAGFDTGVSKDSPVVPIIIGNSVSTLLLADRALQAGINVRPIVYPAVEDAQSRLRFFITSAHTDDQIRETIRVLKKELPKCVSL